MERVSTSVYFCCSVNASIPRGSLVAVVGQVGSGKSSLISAILGEMQNLDGSISITVGSCNNPWSAWVGLKYNKRPIGLSSFVNCPPVVASFLTQRQLSINAGWQHMGRVPHPNYVDPECYVATVCHHVRFMYWEHLGHFQRAISHLKWHKIVCMRYLACAFSQMKSTDMFSMYLQSGVPRHFIWWFIAGWT